jgi:TetR/AcrR family transcriptional regulator, transcriptional repressor for nem operon
VLLQVVRGRRYLSPQAFGRYLSVEHRDNPAEACSTASLVRDAVRQSRKARVAYYDGVKEYLADIETCFEGSRANQKENALSTLALMVGAMLLSRAIGDADEKLSLDFLTAAKKTIKASLK